jgi:hypothetical protein
MERGAPAPLPCRVAAPFSMPWRFRTNGAAPAPADDDARSACPPPLPRRSAILRPGRRRAMTRERRPRLLAGLRHGFRGPGAFGRMAWSGRGRARRPLPLPSCRLVVRGLGVFGRMARVAAEGASRGWKTGAPASLSCRVAPCSSRPRRVRTNGAGRGGGRLARLDGARRRPRFPVGLRRVLRALVAFGQKAWPGRRRVDDSLSVPAPRAFPRRGRLAPAARGATCAVATTGRDWWAWR